MKYEIRSRDSLKDLCDEINRMISDGWIPSGGVSVTPVVIEDSKGWQLREEFLQAIVKEEP